MNIRSLVVSAVALALVANAGLAQVDRGTIGGIVRDQTGAAIPSATVKLLDTSTRQVVETQSSNDGYYSVPNLKPSVYDISVVATGFQSLTKTGISLRVQDRLAVDFDLEIGQASTAISVQAEVPHLDSETSSLGQVVQEREMKSLPLNGRNYIQLATLASGTSPSQRSTERNTFVANGARPIQNSYLLDGVDNKNKIVGFDSSAAQSIEPVIDAIEEFKVQTSTFSAEFGQSAGAVVNATIKSGTNRLHGSLFEFVRNSVFDAQPYFQPPNGTRPSFIQNQFGATVGGPVIKDRTFFFAAWQSSREVNAAPQLAAVPSLANIAGQFTQSIFDPATTRANPSGSGYVRHPFPGNLIPASRFDAVSANLLDLFPAPNLTGRSNYFSNQKEALSNDQYIGRIDHHFGSNDAVFARYVSSDSTNILPAPLPPPANHVSENSPEAHSFAASETHIFRANLFNEARIGYQETREVQQTDVARLFDQYGIIGAPDIDDVHGLPTFAISGLSTLGTAGPGNLPTPATGSGNLPIDKQGRTIQVSENMTWVHGRQTTKAGFDFQQVTLYANSTLQARPNYAFSGVYTQDPQNRAATGAAFADFLLGFTSASQVSTRSISESRQHIYQAYVQNDWNVTSRLTLNAGVRYELPMPFFETEDKYANVILEPGALHGTILDAHNISNTGYRRSFSDPNWHNFAPRVGLAYKLDSKTVLRSAFGLFYGRDENVPVARRPTNNPPYFILKSYTSDQINPSIVLAQGFPTNALDPSNVVNPTVNSYLRHAPTPYVQQWNLNVQREIGAGFVVQFAYVGSSSHDLYFPTQIDTPAPGPGSVQARRPFPQYSALYEYAPFVSSNYNSLQAQLERRFKGGLSVLAAYTWSHSIDNGSSNADKDSFAPQNPFDFRAERGASNFDLRQRFVFSSVWELPFGKGRRFLTSGAPAALAGGWQAMGIITAQTGIPFTPVLSFDPTNTGTTARPNRIASGISANPTVQSWFDASAFVTPPAYTFGNSGRNILSGPGFHNVDLGLSRLFVFSERWRLEFRAEAFNLFNTPQLGLPNATLGVSSTAAISTVVNPQRELQLALRLQF